MIVETMTKGKGGGTAERGGEGGMTDGGKKPGKKKTKKGGSGQYLGDTGVGAKSDERGDEKKWKWRGCGK